MRATLPLMLAASLAVHALLAGGLALWSHPFRLFHEKPQLPEDVPTLTFIKPEPVRPASVPSMVKPLPAPAAMKPVALSQPPALPKLSVAKPASPVLAKGVPVLPKAPPGMEANPNANLPAVSSELALVPSPPPNLDGTKGVVFILDISGSMYEAYAGATRLTYAREALARRVRALPDGTPFAVVLYAQRSCPSGPLVAASNITREAAVRFLMRDVDCGGGTNVAAGLLSARGLRTGAIVLATDGDLNVSLKKLSLSAEVILGEPGACPSLNILGVGPRPDTDATQLLQTLADQQDGSYQVEQSPEETALLTK